MILNGKSGTSIICIRRTADPDFMSLGRYDNGPTLTEIYGSIALHTTARGLGI